MRANLNLSNTRSVAFSVESYSVDAVRTRPLRHRIYSSRILGMSATPAAIDGRIGLGQILPHFDGGSQNTRLSEGQISGMEVTIVHNHRHFRAVVGGDVLNFTEPFDEKCPIDGKIKNEGEIKIPADVGGIIGFDIWNGLLIIVCEYSILTLDATYYSGHFRLSVHARLFKKVLNGTAQVIGDEMYVLTRGGLCRIARNGAVTLLDIPAELLFGKVFDDGGGVFAFRSAVTENRYLLELADKFLVIEKFHDSYMFVCKDPNEPAMWETDWFSLSYAASRQWLKQLRLSTTGGVTIDILTEDRVRTINLSGSENVQRLNINLKGEAFKIRIRSTDENICIRDLTAVIAFGRAN